MADERSVNRRSRQTSASASSRARSKVRQGSGARKSVDYAPPSPLREMIGETGCATRCRFLSMPPAAAATRLTISFSMGRPAWARPLSHIMAHEMNANLKVTAGPAIEKAGDLAAILTNFAPRRHPLHRRDSPARPLGRRDPLSGHGGFCARYRGGQRAWREHTPQPAQVYGRRRYHAPGVAHLAPARPLRRRRALRLLRDARTQEIVKRAAAKLELQINDEGASRSPAARGTPRISASAARVRDFCAGAPMATSILLWRTRTRHARHRLAGAG